MMPISQNKIAPFFQSLEPYTICIFLFQKYPYLHTLMVLNVQHKKTVMLYICTNPFEIPCTLEIPLFTYLDGLECLPAILLFFVTRLLLSAMVSSCIGLEVIGSLKVKDTIISSNGISSGNRLWISIWSPKFEPGVT